VIRSAWLIAEREFRTYAATWSFWLALLLGPVLLAGAFLAASAPHAPVPFRVASSDPQLAAAARRAVAEAIAVEGGRAASGSDKGAKLGVRSLPSGGAILTFDPDFPLTPSGRMLVVRTLDAQRAAAQAAAGKAPPPLVLAPSPPEDLTQASRFAVVLMLWLSLTGSLGMLLQAVVRERSNRALETLLASTGPWAIVVGKVAGVGLVSILVLGAWLAAAGVVAALTPQSSAEMLPALLQATGDPLLLGRAGLIYLLAYAFYGLLTVAIGALARDSASAQNLARPMFLVLLVAFFVALSSAGGEKNGLAWLLYVPPFSPFILLMQPASLATEIAACILLLVSAGTAGWVATFLLQGVLGRSLTARRPRD